MKIAFNLPKTEKVIVEYVSNGVKYSAIIVNPKDNDSLAVAMLSKKIGMSQIRDVQPFNRHTQGY